MDFLPGACLVLSSRVVQGKCLSLRRVTPGLTGRRFSSMDSDLEAFSHNPTHDSFAALPVQATAITNYVNQRFLSY